ncbi:MAG: dCTP deaminase [Candidatus Taylorbacteria bacterium RIFCSPHIGHO2_02_FULL_47_18]|uniref:dCTP deaminase n=1 Tax=Candidatus Taylorbacteria bacterium RIFCSPLOWO2_01_FULL_48_100 TaxID=1802322 RepID=A0A1G2NGI5_9BACT|nr:MAG: dCTP deaminase [Candidatus Taylorbacteria bacterium RIFCSPHIGHO2_02_FULL_47_18]OHA34579.1 MAG: dCTP deaminase [Candidatus Taylorbacteria bacterium RIFCSPLOWO2_01_FULL_48_100]OHA40342.1 MAG: dCTP deaminase [Candidatus Taylorbacteria bacterium RIFCSPLOWO2_02_FULL_48_16]OHA45000.1 MAG: dCTP deaminase [Candidatus Taylorbacteria bacterium RIFCSPLOWO2_12_FULL_48_11]
MAILTKKGILERVAKKEIGFSPNLDSFQLQDHAVDLRLGFTFLIPKIWHITARGRESLDILNFDKVNADYFEIIELEQGQYFDLLPNEYVLVSTLESIKVPNDIMAILYPRSSTNRKGLSLDLTGIIDSGYEGQLTLPIRNNTSSQIVRLYPGERLCQIVFEELTEPVAPRKSKYHKRDIIEGIKKERALESRLIFKGDIRKLKAEHAVK